MVFGAKPDRKRSPHEFAPQLMAPCGMNCALCMRYLRGKSRCEGCRTGSDTRAISVLSCTIRTCEILHSSESGYCVDCPRLPCPRLRRLDARYRTKYGMSMLENLRRIGEAGVEAFVEEERGRWACPACGGIRCVHTPTCIYCGQSWA
jgi:hypothetical protein